MQDLKKERHLLENTSSLLLAECLRAGADAAEIAASYSLRSKITIEKQDFQLVSSDEGYVFGIRVLRGAKQGFASCNLTDPKELKDVALRAIEIAGFSPENPYASIESSALPIRKSPFSLWDPGLHKVSLQTQKDWAQWMIKDATQDKRIRVSDGSIDLSAGLFLVTNSKGTHHIEKETACSWGLMGMAVEGDNITSFDYFSQLSRKALSVPEDLARSTRNFRDKLLKNLKTGPCDNYKGIVVFSPRAVIDILLDGLLYHLNGRVLADGTARWKLSQKGERVLSPLLTLTDRPHLIDRTGAASFDREGTPTHEHALICKGILAGFLLDHYSAKALGSQSTGHAAGGPSSLPTVGSHCLCVEGSDEPLSALIARTVKEQKNFLYVQRYSGQSDPVTGDFSGVAKGGEWWVNGAFSHCVKETLISGNLFSALGPDLFGVSQETEVVDSSDESPCMALQGVSVTSG